ncbi:SDR family NAD(P)-dependent oxidoreductase [Algibacter pectinivorans]|uniref:7-alpha-hydroxysteroid dehydrogenase n=1 Tax=Algibacter pectinivorans TaxID=870482 RepID=A0A1I1QEM9_9FLAO|nr:glucose 1-dehydrogenase [Algibacter pectinivorans]SFD20457.1 7-alpha-hydroxysteroid dehydrogenase [Algibacter pectinivorans]
MNKLKDKTAIVTGASKGIGAEIAKAIAKEGAKVIVNYFSDHNGAEPVVKTITKNGGTAIAIKANITKSEDVKNLFEQSNKAFGNLDILINNAGVYNFAPIEVVTEKEFYHQFSNNVLSTIICIQEALKIFNKDGASIINISSIASVKPTPMSVVYSASKSAVDSITQTLSKELGAKNIRVNSILPGPTQTEGNQIAGTEIENFVVANTALGRIGQPKDISELAIFLASNDSSWITGQKIGVSGGFE